MREAGLGKQTMEFMVESVRLAERYLGEQSTQYLANIREVVTFCRRSGRVVRPLSQPF